MLSLDFGYLLSSVWELCIYINAYAVCKKCDLSFQSLLTDEQLSNCPVLILGNKIDKPGAASEDELRAYFNLFGQTTGKVILYLAAVILSFLFNLLASLITFMINVWTVKYITLKCKISVALSSLIFF